MFLSRTMLLWFAVKSRGGEMPLFSVIIPAYNREFMIGKVVQSVLGQTVRDFELIVVDDGSNDKTGEVVKGFQSDKIKYYYQENQGAQVARNLGLAKASGEYVCFLDSDDLWLPTFLEEMYKAFQHDGEVGCVYCWLGSMGNGDVIPGNKSYLSGYMYREALEQGYITQPSGLMIKRQCFDKIGPWDENLCASQDDDICFRLAKVFKFGLIEKALVVINGEYEGSDNRIGASAKRVADGWWTLWNKFENDVLALCGKKVAARHFLECASYFYRAGVLDKCEEAIQKAVSYYGSINNIKLDFERELVDFISNGEIYCYGAGEIGALVAEYIKKSRYDMQAFVVTDISSNTVYGEYPVMSVNDIKAENCKIIISTTEKYHAEIEKSIKVKFGDVPIFKTNNELINYLKVVNLLWEE